MVARLTVLGSGEEGTGPGVVLSVARVAEYSGEETALMQVAYCSLQGYLAHKKTPIPLGQPYDPRHSPTVGS